ncbi:hypothetical protein J6590_008778 [Homalodisca vitripennis]|nr:hypothetical protein J6590_008778 [Homalodisca vitripennis]
MLSQQLRYFAGDNTSTSSEFRSLIPSQTSSSLSEVVRLTLEFPVFGKFLFLKLKLWAQSKVEPEEVAGQDTTARQAPQTVGGKVTQSASL